MWDKKSHRRFGGKLIGICGGYQMLGEMLHDPLGLEGAAGSLAGLGLLPIRTTLAAEKQLRRVTGILALGEEKVPVIGYEIHAGVTETPADASQPMTLHCDDAVISDGLFSNDGLIFGTYLHGLFDEPAACNALLRWAGLQTDSAPDMQQLREHGIDRLADCLADHLNMEQFFALLAEWEQQHAN